MDTALDDWGSNYLRLCLRLDRHISGFVDAYSGPPKLREAVQAEELRPIATLLEDVIDLQRTLPAQGYEVRRDTFLAKQLRAIETVILKLSGESFPYREEVERCFDISPSWVEEARFLEIHQELDEVLPGDGALQQRLRAYRDRSIVTEERVLPLIQIVLGELRRRTHDLVPMPEGEEVEVGLVRDKPWAGYHWYLGQFRSRIEMNVDLPTRAHGLLELFGHEAYPGHHTEATMKEHLLYRGQGHAEAAIAPLLTPANVIAEGVGNTGYRVIFEDTERLRWKNEVLYPQAGVEPVDLEQALRLERARRGLRHVPSNAALLLHEQGKSGEEVMAYLEHYALDTTEEAEHMLRFLESPLFRAYTFCYDTGEDLIEAAMTRLGDRRSLFRRLLTEPWTPSALAALADTGSSDL